MGDHVLQYLDVKSYQKLIENVPLNRERYTSGDFDDMAGEEGWNVKLSIDVKIELLQELNSEVNPTNEVNNSIIVWKALSNLTPSLACESRIWTRLSHVECLKYSRERWLEKIKDPSKYEKAIKAHFFADTLTRYRDDHAISRLWWNAYIAKLIRPRDQRGALELILKTADIRSNIIERPWTSSRLCLSRSLLQVMENDSWVTDKEDNFRNFMKIINYRGGGIVFEVMSDTSVEQFIAECANQAKAA